MKSNDKHNKLASQKLASNKQNKETAALGCSPRGGARASQGREDRWSPAKTLTGRFTMNDELYGTDSPDTLVQNERLKKSFVLNHDTANVSHSDTANANALRPHTRFWRSHEQVPT